MARLSMFFGGLALLLAALGLYGVTSYAVNRRRTEIGIRMALGADSVGRRALVLRRVAWLVAIGVVAGAAISLWASKFVSTLLYGLEPRDPMTLRSAPRSCSPLIGLARRLAPGPPRRADRSDGGAAGGLM